MSPDPLHLVATFVAPTSGPGLVDHVAAFRKHLPNPGSADWLDHRFAVDVPFDADLDESKAAQHDLEELCLREGVDVIVQEVRHRRKSLLLADMDSTMIGQECIDELADFAGLKPLVSAITERAMRGELAFEPALRERVALLEGLPVAIVDEVLSDRITLTPGSRTLVATMQAHGGRCVLVSGGFTLFTGPVATRIGFDAHLGNLLVTENGRFTGQVADPILGSAAKHDALVAWRGRLGFGHEDTMAVGDGANDLAMIGEAGLGVAFRAKPAVAAAADARIEHADLTALLFAQGYRRGDFVDETAAVPTV